MKQDNLAKAARDEIVSKLTTLAEPDPKFKEFSKKIINTPSNIIGVKIPNLRKFAKIVAKEYGEDCWQLLLQNGQQSFEETTLAGLVMAGAKDISAASNNLVAFCPHINNWATCDVVCSTFKVFSKDKSNAYIGKFIALAKSEQEFTARVGLVMLMDYYLKPETIGDVLDCVANLANHAYYVDMAAAWLLSVAVIKCPQPAIELIKGQTLSQFVQNKAISKCQDSYRVSGELKAELKRYRIY